MSNDNYSRLFPMPSQPQHPQFSDQQMFDAAKEYGINVPQQLSDAQLDHAINQYQQPQQFQHQDLSHLSDSDLDNAINRYKQPSYADFTDEQLIQAAKEYGIDVPGSNPAPPLYQPPPLEAQAEFKAPATPPLYQPPPIGYRGPPIPLPGAPDIDRGQLFSDAASNLAIGAANGIVDVARIGEAINPLSGLTRQITGQAPIKERYQALNEQFHIPPETPENKMTRDIGAFIGSAAVTPAFGGGLVGSVGKRIATGALEGGAISSVMEAGRQIERQKFDPLMAALAPLVGGIAGAGSGALMAGGNALLNKLAPEFTKRSEAAAMKAEEEAWQAYEKAAMGSAHTGSVSAHGQAPPQPMGSPVAQGIGSYDEQVRRGVIDVEDETVHKMLTGQISNDPIPVTPTSVAGDARYNLNRDAQGREIKGYERANEGVALQQVSDDILNAEEKQKIERLAKAQLFQKVAANHRDTFAQALHDRGMVELKVDGTKYTIKPKRDKMMINRQGQLKQNEVKYTLSDMLTEPKGGGPRVQIDQAAIDNPMHYELINGRIQSIQYREPTGFADKDALRLKHLIQAEKFWNGLAKEARKDLGDILSNAQKKARLNDPQHHLAVNVSVGPHKVMIEPVNARIEKTFMWKEWQKIAKRNGWSGDQLKAEMQKFFEKQARELGGSAEDWMNVAEQSAARLKQFEEAATNIKALYGYAKKQAPKIAAHKATNAAIMAAGGLGLAANEQEANAYTEGSDPQARTANLAKALGTTVSGAALLYGASRASGMTPQIMQKWIKSGMAASAKVLGDTRFHVANLDKELGTDFAEQWGAHVSAIQQGRMGIVFKDMDVALAGREELRKGTIAAADALNGSGSFANLTQQERNQIVTEFLNEKTLARKFRTFAEQARTWYNAKTPAERAEYRMEMAHITAMERSFNHADTNDWLSSISSSGMRFLFELNPEFHLTNLSDALIAGGSRIGLINMARAYQLLATNKEVQQLFRNSNFTGGIQAESQAINAAGGIRPILSSIKLPSSDAINANRDYLGSFLSSYQKSQALHGTTATEIDYLKAVVAGKATTGVNQNAIDDAWVEAFDNGLRTLGIDPLRLNHNAITVLPGAKYFAAFVNQPARISYLVNEYATNKEYGKMATFLTVMTLLGGRAAIPATARTLWERVDPDSALAAESTLDQLTVWNMAGNTILTGNPTSRDTDLAGNPVTPDAQLSKLVGMVQGSMADKVGYDVGNVGRLPLYMGFGTEHPSLESAAKLAPTTADIISNATSGEGAKQYKAVKQAITTAGMLGLLGPVPVGTIGRVAGVGEQIYNQSMPAYYYGADGRPYAPKQDIPLDDLGPFGWLMPIADKVVPGKPYLIDASQRAKMEEHIRAQRDDFDRAPADMMYHDPLE